MIKRGLFVFAVLIVLAAAASALWEQSFSTINPINSTLYIADNGELNDYSYPAKIRVYSYSAGNWTERTSAIINLPANARCPGLVVSKNGRQLFVPINDPVNPGNSKLKIYYLNTSGLPDGTSVDLSWGADPASHPAGIALNHNSTLAYLVDSGKIREFVYNSSTGNWSYNGFIASETGIDQIAARTGGGYYSFTWPVGYIPPFKYLYVTKKTTGKILIYSKNGTATAFTKDTEITNLPLPTNLKFYNGKLYVAVNGADGKDILVYDVYNNYAPAGDVSSGIVGRYGWNCFELSADETLVFKKAANAAESASALYKIPLASITAGSRAVRVANVARADSVVIAGDQKAIGIAFSQDGSLQTLGNLNEEIFNWHLINHPPTAFNLVSPIDDTVVKDYPTFSWKTKGDIDADPVTYSLRIESQQDPRDWSLAYSTDYNLTSGSYTIPANDPTFHDTTAYAAPPVRWRWKVIAKDRHGATTEAANAGATFSVSLDNSTDPTITSTTPLDNATNISQTAPIVINFSETMESFSATFDPAVTYTVSWNEPTHTAATLTHTTPLYGSTPYTVTFRGKDLYGHNLAASPNVLGADNKLSFTTGGTAPPPQLTGLYPASAPEDGQDIPVIIKGRWILNGSTAAIHGLPLTNPTVIDDKTLAAAIPAANLRALGIDSHPIVVTSSSGSSNKVEFSITRAGADVTPPDLATHIRLTNPANKLVIAWENPTNIDLQTIKVFRNSTDYPDIDENTGLPKDATTVEIYNGTPSEPGAVITVEDANVSPSSQYYYAVYGKDTSGNWNAKIRDGENAGDIRTGASTGGPAAPPLVVTISIVDAATATGGKGLKFDWEPSPTSGTITYKIYRGTEPFFTGVIPADWLEIGSVTSATTFTDDGQGAIRLVGDPNVNYFYCLTATTDGAPVATTVPSGLVGKIDFNLVDNSANGNTSYNWIPIPFQNVRGKEGPITKASELWNNLSLGLGSNLDSFNPDATQDFSSYTFDPDFGPIGTDFPVTTGNCYRVSLSSATNLIFSLVGNVPSTQTFDLKYNSDNTSNNWIYLPFNKSIDIALAETLFLNIGASDLVERFNPESQDFESFSYDLDIGPVGTNFAVKVGESYRASVKQPKIWP